MTKQVSRSNLLSLNYPNLNPSINLLTDFFGQDHPNHRQIEIRNPHNEHPVSDKVRRSARKASVLFLLLKQPPTQDNACGLSFILTRRSETIRFGGHLCLPGGTQDKEDDSSITTALRETHEEIGLEPSDVEVLGTLGKYYSQAGFCITPVFGFANHPVEFVAQTSEVAAIHEIPIEMIFRADSYTTKTAGQNSYYHFNYQDLTVGGPTASLLIGFYESLLQYTQRCRESLTDPL
ncbi:MAG: CoA pyrophosphatase [Pseudomonadales bacterium]|nr:CoA pyrophosphatase [Pseudomonadales bacterium]